MLLVKISNETQVHNVSSRNPGSFLWTVDLPVEEALGTSTMLAGADNVAHSIGESLINEGRWEWSSTH